MRKPVSKIFSFKSNLTSNSHPTTQLVEGSQSNYGDVATNYGDVATNYFGDFAFK